MNKERIIVILGATAVGKTNYSIDLAIKNNTEIISGDSMLFYQGFDIGTAKPNLEERKGIKHYLIDILLPAATFSVADFQNEAKKIITLLNCKGKVPILVGGTGLYIKALLEGYQFNMKKKDENIRKILNRELTEKGLEYLFNKLSVLLPKEAKRIHKNDKCRILSSLESYYLNGQAVSQKRNEGLIYDAKVIGLSLPRFQLYKKIDDRVEEMFKAGWLEEVELLLKTGVPISCQAMQAIGYKEIAEFLTTNKEQQSFLFLKEKIKQKTRNFAKRQLTWFRKMPYINWYEQE